MSYNRKELQVQSSAKKKQNPFLKDMIYDPRGQWAHPGQPTRIPSNQITMAGVPYPVLGIDNFGNQQMMMPGQNYSFPGADYVDEFPIAQISNDVEYPEIHRKRFLGKGESYITKTPFGKHIEKWKYNPLTKTYVAKEIDIAYKDENSPRTVYRKKEIANKNNAYAIHKKRTGMNPWEKWIEKFQASGSVYGGLFKYPHGGSHEPTYADSLALYNNALAKDAYYRNQKDYELVQTYPQSKSPFTEENLKKAADKTQDARDYIQLHGYNDSEGFPELTENQLLDRIKQISNTLYSTSDFLGHDEKGGYDYMWDPTGNPVNLKPHDSRTNPDAPPILYSPYILPQGALHYSYKDNIFDLSMVPYYDPVMVKPWNMLTEKEKEFRRKVKKEGYVFTNPYPEDNSTGSKPKGTTDPNISVSVRFRKMGLDSSFANRKKIAEEMAGIEDYKGTSDQNKALNKWIVENYNPETKEYKSPEEPPRVVPIIAPPSGPSFDAEEYKDFNQSIAPKTRYKWTIVGTLPDGSPEYKKVWTTDDDPAGIRVKRYGGSLKKFLPKAQTSKEVSPEIWEQEIRAIEKQIGDPSGWAMEDYYLLQDKLNAYKDWRENTPEGQAVIDYHNEEGEYDVQLPEHLQDYTNAMMKARLAYANAFGNPSAKRMVVAPDQPYVYTGQEYDQDWDRPVGVPAGNIGTHYMAAFDNYAVPFIQQDPNGLYFNESPTIFDKEAIRFDNPEDARYFSKYYKEVAPDPSYREYQVSGSVNEWQKGFSLNPQNEELNYNIMDEIIQRSSGDEKTLAKEIQTNQRRRKKTAQVLNDKSVPSYLDPYHPDYDPEIQKLDPSVVYADKKSKKRQAELWQKLRTLFAEYKATEKNLIGSPTYTNFIDQFSQGDTIENLEKRTGRVKEAIENNKINYKKGKIYLAKLRDINKEKYKNTKVIDLYRDPEILDELRNAYKTGNLEEKRFKEYYEAFGKNVDVNVIKGSGPNAAYDAERAEQIFNPGGISTAEVAKDFTIEALKFATGPLWAAAAAASIPFAPAIGRGAWAGLQNPYVQLGLTGYGIHDAVTESIPNAVRDFKEGDYLGAAENVGWAALDLAPGAIYDDFLGAFKAVGKDFNWLKNKATELTDKLLRRPDFEKIAEKARRDYEEKLKEAERKIREGLELTDKEKLELQQLRVLASHGAQGNPLKYDPTNWGGWKERDLTKSDIEISQMDPDLREEYFPNQDLPLDDQLRLDNVILSPQERAYIKNLEEQLKRHEPGSEKHTLYSELLNEVRKNAVRYHLGGKPLTGSDAFSNITLNQMLPIVGTAGLTGLGAYNQYQEDEGHFPQEAGLGLLGSLALGLPMLRNMKKRKGINYQEEVFKPLTYDERMERMDLNMGGSREVLFDPTTDEGKRLMDYYKRKGVNIDSPTVKRIHKAPDDTTIKEERIEKFKEQQQKEFDLGKEFAANWILDVDAQKKFLKDHNKLSEEITQAKVDLHRSDWNYHHGKLTNEWFNKNPDIWDDPDGFKKLNKFLEESAERMNLTKEYKEYRKLEKRVNDLHDAKRNFKSKSVDPEFKRKVKEIYLKTMQGDPKNIESFVENMHNGNLEVIYGDKNILVDPDIADEVFRSLPKKVQEYVNENINRMAGVAFHSTGDTLTFKAKGPGQFEGAYGKITLPEPTLKPKEVTKEKDFSLLKPKTWTKKGRTYTDIEFEPEIDYTKAVVEALVTKRHVNPLRVGETAAHETAHPSQNLFGGWIDELQKYDPDYGYVTGHERNELAKAYKEAMVEPTKVPEGSDRDYTLETWKSGVGELHSELMKARLKAAREYMNQGYSMEEAIDILKQFEKEGNDELFEFYLDSTSGNLDKHFKESTDYDTKKMLIQILPAGATIFGFSMLNNNDNSNLDKQKYGGGVKDYTVEYLTDEEIKNLQSQGFKVVVED